MFERKQAKDKGESRTVPGNIADALAQLESLWGEKIPVVGVRMIKVGEKYPKNMLREEKTSLNFNMLKDAERGKSCVVKSMGSGVKGTALYANFDGRNPDFMFARVDEEPAEEIHQAVNFEGGEILFGDLPDFPLKVHGTKRVIFFKHEGTVWCALTRETFLILPLLLRRQ
jgi:hypothetical protein